MFKQLKLVASLAITATLAACGGGGGEDSVGGSDSAVVKMPNGDSVLVNIPGVGSDSVGVNNPLKKYEGTWYVCYKHQKVIYSISTIGANDLSLNHSVEVYSADDCSGSILAIWKLNGPHLMTYKDITSATLPAVTVLPFSATVDGVSIVTSPSTATITLTSPSATLTGPGVKDDCVSYSDGATKTNMGCFPLEGPKLPTSGALYLTPDNQYLVQLFVQSGVLMTKKILSQSSTFNWASLVTR
jgi:hypothetical protein